MSSLNNVATTAPANLQEVATTSARRLLWDKPAIAGLVMMGVTAATLMTLPSTTLLEAAPVEDTTETESDDENETTTVINWSGTHSIEVPNKNYFEPENIKDLEKIVKQCHETSTPIRPVGSALSPNGIAFMKGGMVSLANLDNIINVNPGEMTVTVQAGARVSQVNSSSSFRFLGFELYIMPILI
jgi:hypothetical protein